MGLTALTHTNSPYSADYVHDRGNVGLAPEFQAKQKGLEAGRKQRTVEEIRKNNKKQPYLTNRVPWDWE